ncbi:MAG: D-alanyl-D-alanine carboxypeptidase/D-alanyl-D-alanine-endopeptidase [Gammaproteobacteria bacterium]|nr:D-alanyl-D-alanine carboxypeptidase/D-alanyl-D-alanine-endopeptidase [Gammaproteobacteria bacterium]
MSTYQLLPHIRKYCRWFAFCLLFSVPAACSQPPPPLVEAIDQALSADCLDPEQTAASIVMARGGKAVYTRNIDLPLLPASVMKLVTSAAALHYLGPEYRFKTEVLYSGKRAGNVILGDLIIRGGGDPWLSSEDLWHIVIQIRKSGINRITGKLVADPHFFDGYDLPPAWDQPRTQRAYDAKLGALSLSFNTMSVHVQPGSHPGDEVNAWLEPAPAYMHLSNLGKTVQKRNSTIWAQRRRSGRGEMHVEIRGKLPVNAREKVIFLNVDNPTRYTAETFRSFLQHTGIRIDGPTKIQYTPKGAVSMYSHSSAPLSLILKELNTYSNNFVAEQILKTIAAEQSDTPGSHAMGIRLLNAFLQRSGVDTKKLLLADASGLSRKNRFTARAMTDFLTAIMLRFDIGPDFLASLRIMGAHGVLSKRLANSPARTQVRAKTGTLAGLSNLAGYVASSDGRLFAYALFLNNNRCGYKWADVIEDSIVTAIHKLGSNKQSGPQHVAAR